MNRFITFTTITDLHDFACSRLDISVPESILRATMNANGYTLHDLSADGNDEDGGVLDSFLDELLERCQAFDEAAAWEMVLGSRTAAQVATECKLAADKDAVEKFLTEAEAEAVKYGAEIDFTSFSARQWHEKTVAELLAAAIRESDDSDLIDSAAEHIGATLQQDGRHIYVADETGETWSVSPARMRKLGEALASGTPDAYSHWCGGGDDTLVTVLGVDLYPCTKPVDTDAIEALLDEARAAGDLAQADLCERALDGDANAIAECSRVIADAAAQDDDAQDDDAR